MRISDWSSDVCSSDLPKVNGAVVVLAEGDERWPGWNEFEGKPLRTCIGGAARADSVLAGLAALPDDVRPDNFVLVHDAARPNLSATDLDQLLERSEEHTSELQPLMRISYAVFCLKKKREHNDVPTTVNSKPYDSFT